MYLHLAEFANASEGIYNGESEILRRLVLSRITAVCINLDTAGGEEERTNKKNLAKLGFAPPIG